MKKLSTLFLLLAATFANAQEHKGFGVSLRTGVSTFYSSSQYNNSFSEWVTPNYGIGVFYEVPMGEGYTFRPQLNFLNRSFRNGFSSSSLTRIGYIEDGKANTRYYFVSPGFTIVHHFDKKKLKPFIQFGLLTDIYLNTHISYSRTVWDEAKNYWSRNSDFRGASITGILAGGISKRHWELMLELNPSLLSFTNEDKYVRPIQKVNIHTLSLIVGYRF